MTLPLSRLFGHLRLSSACNSYTRSFSSSSSVLARQSKSKLDEDFTAEDVEVMAIDEGSDVEDSPSGGHFILNEHRETLHYLRLIELELPKLVAFRKPFVPPTNRPLAIRSIRYAGEEHPAAKKRVVVVNVDALPLKGEDAIHKFKLLAGARWTPNPPADAGVSDLKDWGHGFIKISCEDFPRPAMNLKWASDTLDKLIAEANNSNFDFKDVPIDLRHIYAKARKAKQGDHLRNRILKRPSLLDFPKEWLPDEN